MEKPQQQFQGTETARAAYNQLELAGVYSLNWFFSRQRNNLHTMSALLEFTSERSHNLATIQL